MRQFHYDVNKTRMHVSRKINSGCIFPQCFSVLPYGNFNENASMRAEAKNLGARASEHSSNFCEQFEQRPNFASTFTLNGTIRYPFKYGGYPWYLENFWNYPECYWLIYILVKGTESCRPLASLNSLLGTSRHALFSFSPANAITWTPCYRILFSLPRLARYSHTQKILNNSAISACPVKVLLLLRILVG